MYMLVRNGFVQRMPVDFRGNRQDVLVWPVTKTWEDAKKLCTYLKVWKSGIRPSKIGSVNGETLEGHITLAVEEGVKIVALIDWKKDGSPDMSLIDVNALKLVND